MRFGYGYGFYSANLFYNPFFFDPFFGFGDPFFDDSGALWDTSGAGAPDASLSYDGEAPPPGSGDHLQRDEPGTYAGGTAPVYGPSTEPGPWAQPGSPSPQAAAPLRAEDPVTIIFKDGRPAEHIRNYALTRSALLVAGERMREIPLEEIDLARTQQVNRAAGIDFRLPQSY